MGAWAPMGLGLAALARWRMRKVEDATGERAEPANEGRILWHAGAVIAWPTAAVLALVGLASRRWTRSGRDAAYILVGHFTAYVLVACGVVIFTAPSGGPPRGSEPPVAMLAMVLGLVAVGFGAAAVLMWRWASARTTRIEAMTPTGGPSPGAERWAIYAGSLMLWPVGFIAALIYDKPENVRVGTTAMKLSALHLVLLVVASLIGVAVFAAIMSARTAAPL